MQDTRTDDLFERLLHDENVTTDGIAERLKAASDPNYQDKNRPLSMTERRDKMLAERAEKELRIQQATCTELPLDYENRFESDARAQGVYFENVSDALVHCYRTLGRVDLEYIAAVTKREIAALIRLLQGAIYQNPETWEECFYKGWEMAEEYLSGNLIRKHLAAQRANRTYNDWFMPNVKAIEALLPKNLLTEDIYVHPSSPWLPPDIHEDFIKRYFGSAQFQVKHDEKTGTWEVPSKALFRNNPDVYSKYGTRRMDALEIYERTLNGSPIKVMDERFDMRTFKMRRVLNQAETVLALEKQKLLVQEFQDWVWRSPKRKQRLQLIFAEKYGCYRRRKFDGSFLTFPGMNPDIQLYPYQKDAVARIIFSPNVLLAHDVGAGKSYEMIAAGMELKRMGISEKNLYVVPNNILAQWETMFRSLYKKAKIKCVYPKDFTPETRDATLQEIRRGVYDAVLMPYSIFDRIPLSRKWIRERFMEEQAELDAYAKSWDKNTAGIRKAKKDVKSDARKLMDKIKGYEMDLYFDELGFTRLFVDECHNYKNVSIETRNQGIRGISNVGSFKCEMMLEKVRYIQKLNGGGGVVMATGTPLTNSLSDAFVIQQYLQSGELALLDIQTFDAWVGMFAEQATEFEIDVDTENYRMATRLSKFHNMTELTALFSSFADFHSVEKGEDIPDFNGYTDHLLPRSKDLQDFLAVISRRADDIHNGKVKRTEDNMLLLTVDGRKAALDICLVNPVAAFSENSKVFVCAQNVEKIYRETAAQKSTQLVFCDISTPSDKFNMYDEFVRVLTEMGVPEREIARIHDAKTESQREKLFQRVREGKIRVLIGSTFKLGIGVNVQDKLVAIHHLDVPWRPSDMVQRQGRILRQGNTNKEVFIHRYITEGSFDAYSWQLLETKQRFINAVLSGSLTEKESKDIDDTVLDYAEVKALAVGNPLLKERVETANELSRYCALQRKTVEEQERLRKELLEIPTQRAEYTARIAEVEKDLAFVLENTEKLDGEARKKFRDELFAAVRENTLSARDTSFGQYRGFEVILPAYMLQDRAYVWLQRTGRYRVDIGDQAKGTVIRLDNCIDGFRQRISNLYERLRELRQQEERIRAELKKERNYDEEIRTCNERLQKIDKELGVKKSA